MSYRLIEARAEHAPDLAALLMLASYGVIEALYGGLIEGQPTQKIVERRFHRAGTTGAFENCFVAVDGDRVLGGLHVHPMDDLRKDPEGGIIPPDRYWITAPFEKLDPAAAGSFHINFISVFEPHQGKGIGKALIDLAWREAARRRFKELSLIVFEQNRRALEFYHRLGFAEVARHPAARHKDIRYKCDVLMMVAPVDR